MKRLSLKGMKQILPDAFRDKKSALLSVQWVVVIGTSYFLLFEKGEVVDDPWAHSVVLLLLASILLFQKLPKAVFDHRLFPHALVGVDTLLISIGISFRRESPWDLFLLFFFGLFIAGIGESLVQIIMGCLIISILSVVISPFPGVNHFQIDPDLLLRIPFLFGVFILYGYLAAQAKSEKKRAEQRVAALHDVNSAITSTLDLRTVLDVLLEKIDSLLPYSVATTIRLLNGDTGELIPVASRNLGAKERKLEQWEVGRGLDDDVYETRIPVRADNVQIDERVNNAEFFRKHGLVSYLGVPLIAKGDVLGVLSFHTREGHDFLEEEIGFLTTLAGQAAIAIHNSNLYEQTKNQAVELERSNRVKDEFLSVMSHELRTPLNVIVGYTVMIRDKMLGEINSEQEESLGKVITRAKDLLEMITGILQVTSIEAEAIKADLQEVDLRSFLDELGSGYRISRSKELTLHWNYPPDLPVWKTDSQKLKHILQNLINNAIKFTEKGSVTISARWLPDLKTVEFKVADTGVGIPEDALSLIFEKFRQVDSSETRSYGGVGMGLYIVKKLTELLGGQIQVESKPDKGSTFTVCLPIQG